LKDLTEKASLEFLAKRFQVFKSPIFPTLGESVAENHDFRQKKSGDLRNSMPSAAFPSRLTAKFSPSVDKLSFSVAKFCRCSSEVERTGKSQATFLKRASTMALYVLGAVNSFHPI
jgi:hypothetical protein